MVWRYGGGLLLLATTSGVIAFFIAALFDQSAQSADLSLPMTGCVIPVSAPPGSDGKLVTQAQTFEVIEDANALQQAQRSSATTFRTHATSVLGS